MNKNIIIGLLIVIVGVLGYFVIQGNTVLQEAATIKSGATQSGTKTEFESAIKKSGGSVYVMNNEQIGRYRATVLDVITSFQPSPDLYVYACFVSWSSDPVWTTTVGYYGNVWQPSGSSATCYYAGVTP